MEWLTAHIAADAVFHQGGRFPTAGTYTGRDAIFGHMLEFLTMVDFSMKMTLQDIAASNERVMLILTVALDYQGRHLEFDETHVWRIDDGSAAELWAIPHNPYAV